MSTDLLMKLSVVSSSGLPPTQTFSAPPSNWRRPGAEGELGSEAACGPRHPVRLPRQTRAPGLPPLRQRQTLPSDSPTPPGWPHTAGGGAAGPIGREPASRAGGGSWLVESISAHISEPHVLLFSFSTIAPTLCDSRLRPLSQIDHCDITVMSWTCRCYRWQWRTLNEETIGSLKTYSRRSFTWRKREPEAGSVHTETTMQASHMKKKNA